MNPNFAFLQQQFGITESVFEAFKKIAIYREVKANTTILKASSLATNIYFITSGITRSYLTTESGKEHNKNIYTSIGFMAPLTALILDKPSELSYQALTDCTLFEFTYKDLKSLSKKNVQIANLYNTVLEQVFIAYEKRELELMSLNATQRYELIRERIPNIDKLIPQYQIASYLNITSVQLSRIRKT